MKPNGAFLSCVDIVERLTKLVEISSPKYSHGNELRQRVDLGLVDILGAWSRRRVHKRGAATAESGAGGVELA